MRGNQTFFSLHQCDPYPHDAKLLFFLLGIKIRGLFLEGLGALAAENHRSKVSEQGGKSRISQKSYNFDANGPSRIPSTPKNYLIA